MNGIVLYDTETTQLIYHIDNDVIIQKCLPYPVEFIHEKNIFGSSHGNIFSITIKNKEIQIFGKCKISPELAVCTASSLRYNIIVVGVRSGKILLFNRLNGSYIRQIDSLKETPLNLIITTMFSFIVVHIQKLLILYSINGEKIREKKINFELSMWYSFRSSDGFDYLLISDTVGKLYICEAYYLNVREIYQCGSNIISMKMNNTFDAIAIFTQEGKGIILPFNN